MTARMKAVLVAVLVGAIFGAIVFAEDEGQPIYYPGTCVVLEPFSKWWIFFDCWGTSGDTLESVDLSLQSDGSLVTEIERVNSDGSVTRIRRVQRLKEK